MPLFIEAIKDVQTFCLVGREPKKNFSIHAQSSGEKKSGEKIFFVRPKSEDLFIVCKAIINCISLLLPTPLEFFLEIVEQDQIMII